MFFEIVVAISGEFKPHDAVQGDIQVITLLPQKLQTEESRWVRKKRPFSYI
jgi:hypothetical protein